MADSINVNFDSLALNIAQRLVGNLDLSTTLQPALSGLFSGLFGITSQLSQSDDWMQIAFGAASDASDVVNAYRIAEIVTGLIPVSLVKKASMALRNVVPPAQPASTPPPRDTAPSKDPFKDWMQRLKSIADPAGSAGIQTLNSINSVQQILYKGAAGSIPTPGGGGKWDPERVLRAVQKAIRDALKALSDANLPGDNTKRVAAEVEAEMTGPLLRRLFVALGLTTYGVLMYGAGDLEDLLNPPSGGTFGTEVHQRLQLEYRRPRGERVIVQESTVYYNGFGTPLAKAQTWDSNLYALSIARGHLFSQILTAIVGQLTDEIQFTLKDDIVDLTVGTEWEIKPIRGAALGVLQEFLYRTLFNIVAAFLLDVPELVPKIGTTPKGLVTMTHLRGGTWVDWPEIAAEKVRLIGGFGKLPRKWISLVTVESLPGILLYFTYDLPIAAIVFADALQRLMNKIGKTLDKGFPILIEALVFALMAIAATVVVVGLIVALVSGAAEIAAAVAAVAKALGPVLALAGLKGAELVELVRKLAQQVAPLVSQYGLDIARVDSSASGAIALRFSLKPGTPPEAVPCDDASFGPLRLQNVPMAVLACMPGLFALGMQIAGVMVQKQFAASSSPNASA